VYSITRKNLHNALFFSENMVVLNSHLIGFKGLPMRNGR
jgi:hypothetical protein